MFKIRFTPRFARQAKNLDEDLFQEVLEKVELLKERKNHQLLKVHKLHGVLSAFHSFSVNYKTRIVFEFSGPDEIWCHYVGDHGIYK